MTTVPEWRRRWRRACFRLTRHPNPEEWGSDSLSVVKSCNNTGAAFGGNPSRRRGPGLWSSSTSTDRTAMLHRRHVAIVDDEASVRESLALLLSTAQIESRTFASAEDRSKASDSRTLASSST